MPQNSTESMSTTERERAEMQRGFHAVTLRIGARLRAARRESGLFIKDLVKLDPSGVLSSEMLRNCERGSRRLSIEAAQAVSLALGTVTPAYLLLLDDAQALSADESRLLALYRGHDERGKQTILAMAESGVSG